MVALTSTKIDPAVAINVLAASNEAVVVVDAAGEIIFANPKASSLFEYEIDDLIGQKVEALIPQDQRVQHEELRARYKDSPRHRPLVAGLPLKAMCRTGRIFDAEIALVPIKTTRGTFVASTIRDISTDDTSEAYFRNVLESAPDAMIIIDHYGRISVVNGQTERMFGYSRDEILGQEIEMLLPERFHERHVSHRAAYAGDPHLRAMGSGMELSGRRKDGSEFPVEISLSPVTAASGSFVSSVIRDVTERKKMERELIDARHEAERANKANTAFLAAASHDLRQPVQALSLLNGALRRTVKVPLALEMVESQQQSLDAMTNLLNSLLDISRLDAGAVEPEIEDFRIQRLIDRLSAEFSRQAMQKGLKFSAQDCPTIVRSDPNLLSEIIQNFVSNGIRYTDKGTVRLACSDENGTLRIEVSDSGIGIDPSQIEEIFDEYHQIKTPGADKEGFGLGLAIVKRLADLLGHEISVESVPGSGSKFSISVPSVTRSGADAARRGETRGNENEKVTGLVILIEDDVKVAKAWELLLEAEGMRVAVAASASEADAVTRHLDTVPDLIISDFHLLDGSTGVEAVAAIREAVGKNVPAFIVSGDTSKMVQDAKSTENSITMNKPVNTNDLLEFARAAIATGKVPDD